MSDSGRASHVDEQDHYGSTESICAGTGDAPVPLNDEYGAQCATAGLMFGEATQISSQEKGDAFALGIDTDKQVPGWKLVTDAVLAKGGHRSHFATWTYLAGLR